VVEQLVVLGSWHWTGTSAFRMLKTSYLVIKQHIQKNKILCSINVLNIHMKPL